MTNSSDDSFVVVEETRRIIHDDDDDDDDESFTKLVLNLDTFHHVVTPEDKESSGKLHIDALNFKEDFVNKIMEVNEAKLPQASSSSSLQRQTSPIPSMKHLQARSKMVSKFRMLSVKVSEQVAVDSDDNFISDEKEERGKMFGCCSSYC